MTFQITPFSKKCEQGGLQISADFLPFPIIFHPVWEQNGLRTTPYHFSFPPPFQKKVSKKDLLTQILLYLSNND